MTAATAKTIPEATVLGLDRYYTPIGTSVDELCATEMPNGKVLCTWRYGDTYFRGVVFNSIQDLLSTDAVSPTGGTVLYTNPANRLHGSCFTVGADVFFLIHTDTGTRVESRIYRANDPADPLAGWTLHGAPFGPTGDSPGGVQDSFTSAAGVPMVLPSGRWVLPSAMTGLFFGNRRDQFGLYTSEDGGVTWTLRIHTGYGIGGFYNSHHTDQVGVLPDGTLFVGSHGESTNRYYTSSDGASWTERTGFQALALPIVSNGATSYVTSFGSQPAKIYTIDNSYVITDTGMTVPVKTLRNDGQGSGSNFKAVWFPQAGQLVYLSNDRVASSGGGWLVGQVGIG